MPSFFQFIKCRLLSGHKSLIWNIPVRQNMKSITSLFGLYCICIAEDTIQKKCSVFAFYCGERITDANTTTTFSSALKRLKQAPNDYNKKVMYYDYYGWQNKTGQTFIVIVNKGLPELPPCLYVHILVHTTCCALISTILQYKCIVSVSRLASSAHQYDF